MKDLSGIIIRPLITEKAVTLAQGEGQYCFAVALTASKTDVAEAVQALFKVDVERVHTMVTRGKVKRFGRFMGQSSRWKKAVVKLVAGQKIELFEGKV